MAMRVAELAALTRTTVRAVRYYHRLGILPIPDEGPRYRDYDLSHVARVSRIRWLVESGVPLALVADMLSGEGSAAQPDNDLRKALETLDTHLADLAEQRVRLARLVELAQAGAALTPMPPEVAAFYDNMAARAGDDYTRAEIRRERDLVELACYRGEFPPQATAFYIGLTEADLDAGAAAFGRDPNMLTEAEMRQRAEANVQRLADRIGDAAPQLARSVDDETVLALYRLYDHTSDDGRRRFGEVMREHLMAALALWRTR